jgi:hypothetical protein
MSGNQELMVLGGEYNTIAAGINENWSSHLQGYDI